MLSASNQPTSSPSSSSPFTHVSSLLTKRTRLLLNTTAYNKAKNAGWAVATEVMPPPVDVDPDEDAGEWRRHGPISSQTASG
jgi:hypothetical protein